MPICVIRPSPNAPKKEDIRLRRLCSALWPNRNTGMPGVSLPFLKRPEIFRKQSRLSFRAKSSNTNIIIKRSARMPILTDIRFQSWLTEPRPMRKKSMHSFWAKLRIWKISAPRDLRSARTAASSVGFPKTVPPEAVRSAALRRSCSLRSGRRLNSSASG